MLHAEGNHEQALEELQKAEQVQMHNRPSLYQKMGEALLNLNRWDEAETRFNQILAIDPINPAVRLRLCQCHLARKRPRKALNEAMAAIGLIYHNPNAHYLCGLALQRLGRTQEAMQALHTALAQNPVFPDAHRALARLHTKRFEHPQAARHEQLAQAAEQRIAAFKAGQPLPEDVDLELDVSLTEPASLGDLGAATPTGSLEDAIVIVSGLPRSGTSMLMQMLAAGGRTRPAASALRLIDP